MRHAAAIIDSDRAAGVDAPTPVIVDGLIDEIGRHSPLFPAEQPMEGRS